MVEFAIILPLFLLLLFGVIEFSLLLYNKAMLTNAAREGARYGIVRGPLGRIPSSEIEQVVINYGRNNMITFAGSRPPIRPKLEIIVIDGSTETASPYQPASFDPTEYLRVTAEYDYTFLVLPNIFKLINATGVTELRSPWTLQAISQMRSE